MDTDGLASIEDGGGDELPVAGYRLGGSGKYIVTPEARVDVAPDGAVAYIDNAIPEANEISLSGWAASANLNRPAKAVVAFVGQKGVVALRPSGERQDVADGYEEEGLKNSGFLLRVPGEALDCAKPDAGLTVYAISGSSAGPLEWLADTERTVNAYCESGDAKSPN